MPHCAWRPALLPLLLCLLAGPARASDAPSQEDSSEEPYRPTTSGPFVTYGAPLVQPGRLLIQPLFSLAVTRGDFDEAGRYQPLPSGESRQTASLPLYLEYGLLPRLVFAAQLTAQLNRLRMDAQEASSTGLADTQLLLRGTLLEERVGGLPEVALLVQVELPTGRAVSARPERLDTDVMGSGTTDLTLGFNLTRGLRPVLLHLDVLYTRALPARVDGQTLLLGDTLTWGLASEWPFRRGTLGLMLEATGRHQAAPVLDGTPVPDGHLDEVVLGMGLEVLFSPDVQLLVGYQRTLWGRNVPAQDFLVATLTPVFF